MAWCNYVFHLIPEKEKVGTMKHFIDISTAHNLFQSAKSYYSTIDQTIEKGFDLPTCYSYS